jgi:predicted ATPase
MLERVSIKNFRCLKSVAVELRPLTVLIGANDTGKSAFIAALRVLFTGGMLPGTDYWLLQTDADIEIVGRYDGTQRSIEREPHQRNHYNLQPRDPKGEVKSKISAFELPSSGPVMEAPGHADQGVAPELGSHGENVPALVDYLLRRDRKRFDGFVQAMRNYVPGLLEINVATPAVQIRRLDLKIDSGLEIPADRASVGVRVMLFFAALTWHPLPPSVILLEEPENGVHPRRLADIMRLLRDTTKGAHGGHPAQVILTTHSPYLLDHVNLDEDEVLVFRRNDDGSRTCEPVDRERLKAFLNDFMLGEVWFNEQEEGLVKRDG